MQNSSTSKNDYTSEFASLSQNTLAELSERGYGIKSTDFNRPWGGFIVINEEDAHKFANDFFNDVPMKLIHTGGLLSPKILLVMPEKRLSWQYHHRRSVWKGVVGVAKSNSDEETVPLTYPQGSVITLRQGERHRLVGLKGFAVIAEIWQHTDPMKPSDENDIVRVQDDFGR
jgi:mannose-6-phosphate isomerase